MKSKDVFNNYDVLKKSINLIEELIVKGVNAEEIVQYLASEIPSNFIYFNRIFNRTVEYTLAKYIKRRKLTVAFLKWKKTFSKLNMRQEYEQIPRFKEKFNAEFGISIDEALENGYEEEDLQPILNLEMLYSVLEILDSVSFVDDYKMNKGQVELVLDSKKVLFMLLQSSVYFLPYFMFEAFGQCDIDTKKVMLIVLKKSIETGSIEVKLSFESVADEFGRLEMYDLEKPEYLEDEGYIFKIEISDNMKQIFEEMIANILPYTKETLQISYRHNQLARELFLISQNDDLEILSKHLKLSKKETIEKLWEYFRRGYLRCFC